ncbi:MAG: DUF6151 family protein [Proteobacteria bacterium]|nr:DUF6151 family protein [Pseudomonadota bacterium]
MANDLPIRCRCGNLRGRAQGVSGERGNRIVCYCDDCQAFGDFLGPDGVLDTHGGTDIFQMSPARLEFTRGLDQLACLRLTSKGMLRWYAACCKTPIGNTMATRQIPFVGLIHACVDHEADGRSRDEALGPVRAGVNARFARGDRTQLDAHDRAPLSMGLGILGRLVAARLRGDHAASPFFDRGTGEPVAVPLVLSEDERRGLENVRTGAPAP